MAERKAANSGKLLFLFAPIGRLGHNFHTFSTALMATGFQNGTRQAIRDENQGAE